MPELPEVETVRNILEPLVIGKKIIKVDVFFDKLVLSDLKEFKEKLKDKTILNIDRYGKYLFFKLSDGLVIINHLRMEGKWRLVKIGDPERNKFTTALFSFEDGSKLAFDDTRKFGIMYLSNENEYKSLEMISKLGIEPTRFTEKDLVIIKKKFNKNKCLKDLLLDQTIFCGIGNIYADEIAYDTKLSPFTKGNQLSEDDIKRIAKSAKNVLLKAIECGGSTIHSFHPQEGVDGRMQGHLKCYGKAGEICPICGTKFHKTFIGGRGTTYCPNCQIDSSIKKAIGITGPIGSGKSEVLNFFKEEGYYTISCDELVHELYRVPHIKNRVSRIIGIDFDIDSNEIKKQASKILISNPVKRQKVEDYIYPLLEDELLKNIKKYDNIAIEVPLLFKAHFEYMFKKIIVLEVSPEKQTSNLISRNSDVETSKKINSSYSYNKNNHDVNVVINDSTLENLKIKIKGLI